jgi:two-component system osmolarity sensor histidine kinase EnvZ
MLAWVQIFLTLNFEPQVHQNAQQISVLIEMTQAALRNTPLSKRADLIRNFDASIGVFLLPFRTTDHFEIFPNREVIEGKKGALVARLGANILIAQKVNGQAGLWFRFFLEDGSAYWLRTEPSMISGMSPNVWGIGIVVSLLLSLIGAAVVARVINLPLQKLSQAAERVKRRDLQEGVCILDENVKTQEIRQVNQAFNEMTEHMFRLEKDRALILAGISHDLRTPLARLRLEAELSIDNPSAQAHAIADIAHINAILDRFVEYAQLIHHRESGLSLDVVILADVLAPLLKSYGVSPDMAMTYCLEDFQVAVLADRVELERVVVNLLENARRYGRYQDQELSYVAVNLIKQPSTAQVHLEVQDQGPGVSDDVLHQLTQPFFRGDLARTAAQGTGLGLAIVARAVQTMRAQLHFANVEPHGLKASVTLLLAS